MVIRIPKNPKNSFTRNVSFMFVVYWAILVLWQNITVSETHDTVDTAIKIILLIYFAIFYMLKAKTMNTKVLLVLLLAISLMITAVTEKALSFDSIIAYAYPVLILFLVYGLGDGLQINRFHLYSFCNCIIWIVAYTVFYAILFCNDQYAAALSAQSAYGNELCSFFISNHEYGMYLVAAIISSIVCLRLYPDMGRVRKSVYVIAIALFALNLVLTFSRTSMLGLGVFLLTYCFFETPKARKWIVIVVALIGLALLVFPALTDFVYKIVLKENNAAGRDDLSQYGLQYFKNGTVFEKIFGHGIQNIKKYFKEQLDHSSAHNGYLQVLLNFGLVGCGAMVLFLLSQVGISFRFRKVDRFIGTLSLALVLCAAAMMFTNTAIVFMSPIDSFFLTMFFIWVPKYVRNSVSKKEFDNYFKDNGNGDYISREV